MEAQSTESTWIYDFFAWLDANWKRVLIGAGVIVVIALAVAIYFWQKNQSEIQANDALFAAAPAAGQKTLSPEEYAKVAQEHPKTSAAERAELLAASASFGRGEYSKAQGMFETFSSQYPNSQFLSQAAYGIAAALEAQGKTDLAIKKYEEVARAYPTGNVAAQAKLAIGRLYENSNQSEKALAAYTELEKSITVLDMWKTEAVDRREKLLARHPELRKEVAAPAAAPEEQIIEVTTPPEGSTEAPKVKILTNPPASTTGKP